MLLTAINNDRVITIITSASIVIIIRTTGLNRTTGQLTFIAIARGITDSTNRLIRIIPV